MYGGGTGHNLYRGGAGNDTVVFYNNVGDYTITPEGSNRLKVDYGDGTVDTVYNDVETLRFANGDYEYSFFL